MEGWISDKLENLFETGSGTTPQSTNSNYYDGNINWLLTGDLNDGIITSTSKKITSKALSDYSTLKLYPKNSVVIALYGATIGKLGFLDIESTTNQACCVLFNSKRMEQKYLFYNLLFAKNRILALAVGGGQPNISQNIVKNFEISFPELQPEQQKIATILSTIDQTIAQTEQLIAKYKNIKQGLMHDLLTYGIDENGTIRNPQTHTFVEKKGLVVPEEWEVEEIGSNGSVTKLAGFEYTKYFDYNVTGEIIAIRGLNLKNGKLDLKEIQTIPEQVSKSLLRSKLYVNDIVISYVGTVGEIAVIDENDKYHLAPNVAKISFANTNYCAHFIKAFLMSEEGKKAIKFETNSTTQPALSMGNIRKINIPKPMIKEQVKIVSILQQQDKLIESEQINLAKLQNLKQGLMANLLTGKVRVELKEIHNYV